MEHQYLFPNDTHILWSLMIVMYPYITGIVAGAFIVSSLYHVFNKTEFKPVARLSLYTSLAFLLFATCPLLLHLGHPERAFKIMTTPNLRSAMAGFGFLYLFYMIILVLEVWLVCRKDIVEAAARARGIKRFFYKVLALGVYDISEEAIKVDHKVTTVLASIGIPAACMLHGYVGFIFGGVKANPWWSTPLMPIIFLFSAMISGVALLIILYQAIVVIKGWVIDRNCITALCKWLWLFMIMSVTLELLEIIMLAYEQAEEWEVISVLLSTNLGFSYISLQMIIGSLIPFILLGIVVLYSSYMMDRLRNSLAIFAALLLLVQVLAMRWNVVVGGQMFSKSLRGFRDFTPEFFGREGVATSILLLLAPFIILYIFNRVLPVYKREDELTYAIGNETVDNPQSH